MGSEKQTVRKGRVANGFGYFFVFCAWIWTLFFYLPFILQFSGIRAEVGCNVPVEEVPSIPTTFELPQPVSLLVAGIVLALFVLLLIYMVRKLPGAITTRGEKLTQASSTVLLPLVTHHKTLKPAEKRRLSIRLTFFVRVALAVLPVIAILPLGFLPYPVDFGPAVPFVFIVGIVTANALLALVLFGLGSLNGAWGKKKSGKQGKNGVY